MTPTPFCSAMKIRRRAAYERCCCEWSGQVTKEAGQKITVIKREKKDRIKEEKKMAYFEKALPIWLEGREKELNVQAVFCTKITCTAEEAKDIWIDITGATLYRLWVNGSFGGYGPARAAHGYVRVDRLSLASLLKEGENEICIEVAGYVCPSYYTICQSSFLQAEVYQAKGLKKAEEADHEAGQEAVQATDGEAAQKKILAATGFDFTGSLEASREQKVHRYSFQRTFSEVWNRGIEDAPAKVSVADPGVKYLERGTQLPDYTLRAPLWENSRRGTFTFTPEEGFVYARDRYIAEISEEFPGFTDEEIEKKPYYTWQRMEFTYQEGQPCTKKEITLKAGEFVLLDMGQNRTGFIRSHVKADADAHYMVSFDEKLTEDIIDYHTIAMINLLDYQVPAGEWENESFEAYGFRYACVMVTEGELTLVDFGTRSYIYKLADIPIHTGDEKLDEIFGAAVETFRQNTLDIYMDCPTRERAGWLCDSYFTSQSELVFTGKNDVEKCFMENFRLFHKPGELPEGMLPMCYPSDHWNHNFIPQWAMWYILELKDFLERSPEVNAEDYRKLCYDLLGFFARYENEDGLLDRLPGWKFVEWSRANDWVNDVNYPTNMLYSKTCQIIGKIYGDEALLQKAEAVKEKVIEKSFNGYFFEDHALYNEAGELVNAGDISECCQYYAIRFLDIDVEEEKYQVLKDAVLHYYLPEVEERQAVMEEKKAVLGTDGEAELSEDLKQMILDTEPANALMGVYLRMEILYTWGCFDQLKAEMKEFFGKMAQATGTLWENKTSCASLNHGFASFAGALILKMQG